MAEERKGSGDDVERGRLTLTGDARPMPFEKYRSHMPLVLGDRTWPDAQFTRARGGSVSTCVTGTRR